MHHRMNNSGPRPRRRERGAAIVEFALVAILFFTLLLTIIDFSYLFFANISMQHAVREGARYAVTGQSNLDPKNHDRCAAARARIISQSMGLFNRTSANVTFSVLSKTLPVTQTQTTGCGLPGDIIIITVNCRLPVLTPFLWPIFTDGSTPGVYVFTVSSTMKLENF